MVQARTPHPVDLPPAPATRPWNAILASLVLHLCLVAAIFLLRRSPPEAEAPAPETPAAPAVQMVYLQPPPQPTPPPPERPREAPRTPPPPELPKTRPAPPHDEPAPMAPDAQPTPPEPAPAEAPARPQPAPPAVATGPAPAPSPTAAAGTMESEARRLFGRHKASATQAGPVQVAGLPVYIPDDGRNRCTPKPRDPDAPVQLGHISGRITTSSGIPLPGAHLQILGTPYVTFADGRGDYTLAFDKSLVDDCRSQVVRVTAPGYRAMNLVLALGPTGTNDVEMARQ